MNDNIVSQFNMMIASDGKFTVKEIKKVLGLFLVYMICIFMIQIFNTLEKNINSISIDINQKNTILFLQNEMIPILTNHFSHILNVTHEEISDVIYTILSFSSIFNALIIFLIITTRGIIYKYNKVIMNYNYLIVLLKTFITQLFNYISFTKEQQKYIIDFFNKNIYFCLDIAESIQTYGNFLSELNKIDHVLPHDDIIGNIVHILILSYEYVVHDYDKRKMIDVKNNELLFFMLTLSLEDEIHKSGILHLYKYIKVIKNNIPRVEIHNDDNQVPPDDLLKTNENDDITIVHDENGLNPQLYVVTHGDKYIVNDYFPITNIQVYAQEIESSMCSIDMNILKNGVYLNDHLIYPDQYGYFTNNSAFCRTVEIILPTPKQGKIVNVSFHPIFGNDEFFDFIIVKPHHDEKIDFSNQYTLHIQESAINTDSVYFVSDGKNWTTDENYWSKYNYNIENYFSIQMK